MPHGCLPSMFQMPKTYHKYGGGLDAMVEEQLDLARETERVLERSKKYKSPLFHWPDDEVCMFC